MDEQRDSVVAAIRQLPGVDLEEWGRQYAREYGPWTPTNANYEIDQDKPDTIVNVIENIGEHDGRCLPTRWKLRPDHVVADMVSKHSGPLLFRFVVLKNAKTEKWRAYSAHLA